jgi:amino acid permease
MRSIRKNLKANKPVFQGGLFLFGAIVGIGIFALPFAVYRFSLLKGFFALILAGLSTWALNVAYAKLVLVSGENFQLGSYGRRYWGNIGWLLGSLTILININGALLVYLIGVGNFLHFLFPVLTSFFWGLVFFLIIFPVIALRLRMIVRVNEATVWLLIFIIISFLIWGTLEFGLVNFTVAPVSGGSFFQLFSIFFFSFAGFTVIPELAEILNFEKKPILRAVAMGSLLPGVLYALFIVVGLGVLGSQVSEEFILGLGEVSLTWAWLLSLAAIAAIGSSFFAFGFTLREFWQRDFGFTKSTSLILILLPLLLFYLFGNRSFLGVISFTGAASCLLMGGLILACWLKIGPRRTAKS